METLIPTMWSKSHPAWGQRRRIQRNYYAYLVATAMTRGVPNRQADIICPACHGPMDLDYAEVDRAIPSLDYTPGNITYVCHGCNHGRGILQSTGQDWTYVDMYIADIRRASLDIDIPTEAIANQWWANRPTVGTLSRYA
jgi:hypothetical protein